MQLEFEVPNLNSLKELMQCHKIARGGQQRATKWFLEPCEPRLSIRKMLALQQRAGYLGSVCEEHFCLSSSKLGELSLKGRQLSLRRKENGLLVGEEEQLGMPVGESGAGSGMSTKCGVIRQLRNSRLFPGSHQDSVFQWSIAVIRPGNSELSAMKHGIKTC